MHNVHYLLILAMFDELKFSDYICSCDIDFVRFLIDKFTPLPTELTHAKLRRLRAGGLDGMLLTIHDPKPQDFALVEKTYPTAKLNKLEVFYDFKPKRPSTPAIRDQLLYNAQQWIISHLYPWHGKGLQVATRVSKGKRHSEPVFNDVVARRPEPNETMYFGHSKSLYADPALPNLAFMRLYIKKTDHRTALLPDKWRTRIEVNLNSGGCKQLGLNTPTSIYGFTFRSLGAYLNFFKPASKRPIFKKMRRWNPKMAALLEPIRQRLADDTLKDAGAHAGSHEKLINYDRNHRHASANKMIRDRLDDLTHKYRQYDPVNRYGSEWGSW